MFILRKANVWHRKTTFLLVSLAAVKILQKRHKFVSLNMTNLADNWGIDWHQSVRNSMEIGVGWLVFPNFQKKLILFFILIVQPFTLGNQIKNGKKIFIFRTPQSRNSITLLTLFYRSKTIQFSQIDRKNPTIECIGSFCGGQFGEVDKLFPWKGHRKTNSKNTG